MQISIWARAALAVVAPSSMYGQFGPVDTIPAVEATGTARRTVRPNQATLTIRFAAADSTPAAAGARTALKADSVRRTLVRLGIPGDSVVTGSRNYWWPQRVEAVGRNYCRPRVGSPGCDQIHDSTYRVREALEVRMSDVSKVGAVIDAMLAHGITDLSPIRFTATDTRAAEREAIHEATVKAREHAETIAVASGGRLGRTLTLRSQGATGYSYYNPWDNGSMRLESVVVTGSSEGMRASGTEITAPSVTVSATIYGRWRLDARP
jgi:uncharacterized protein